MFLLPDAFVGHCGNIPKSELYPFADYPSAEPSHAPTSLLEAHRDSLSPEVTEYLEKNQLREDKVSMDSWLEGRPLCQG